jgi:hypothetical protein
MAPDESREGSPGLVPPVLLAIDPGREKNGLVVVHGGTVLARAVVTPDELVGRVRTWRDLYQTAHLLIGGGTGHRAALARLAAAGLVAEVVPEAHTTLRARARYFRDHPPTGWRRLIPRGLLTPPVPIDDYAALLIAEAFLERGS